MCEPGQQPGLGLREEPARFGQRRRALLVIDCLNDFMKPEGSLYIGPSAPPIVPVIETLIEDFRGAGDPVIFICDEHAPDDREFEMFPPHCVRRTWGARIIDELEPARQDVVVRKRRFSGFFATDLDLVLRELDVSRVLVTGVCANICVLYTTADARMRGYEVEVKKDAVASFDPAAHDVALKDMQAVLGARVT